MKKASIVIVTGMSGSGKTIASNALEDTGYFCIDNLPVPLMEKLVELTSYDLSGEVTRFGLVMDSRDPAFLARAGTVFDELRRKGHQLTLVFLDTDDEVLRRRYSETRRIHPQSDGGSLTEAIARERHALIHLRNMADWVVDTSELTPHDLRRIVQERFSGGPTETAMSVRVVSFGYRYGLPGDADLVVDVRFLPNPFFVESLRDLTGEDRRVADFVLENPVTREFLDRLLELLAFLIPQYQREGKSYLTIALGCTGGRHRSVAIALWLAAKLKPQQDKLTVRHRDIKK